MQFCLKIDEDEKNSLKSELKLIITPESSLMRRLEILTGFLQVRADMIHDISTKSCALILIDDLMQAKKTKSSNIKLSDHLSARFQKIESFGKQVTLAGDLQSGSPCKIFRTSQKLKQDNFNFIKICHCRKIEVDIGRFGTSFSPGQDMKLLSRALALNGQVTNLSMKGEVVKDEIPLFRRALKKIPRHLDINVSELENIKMIKGRYLNVYDQDVVAKYIVGRFLGKGAFACCYQALALHRNTIDAVKIIPKGSLSRNRHKQALLNSIKINRSLRHKHIVQFKHLCQDQGYVYLILELCSHGSLTSLLRRRKQLSEMEVRYYGHQIISAIHYLHSRKVIHRDIGLNNLLINDEMEIKLGDFKSAFQGRYGKERDKDIPWRGTIRGKNAGYSYEADVWSFGIVLYTLLVGHRPFDFYNHTLKGYEKVANCEVKYPPELSKEVRHLFSAIFVPKPSERITCEQVLRHPFFTCFRVPTKLPAKYLVVAPRNEEV